MTHVTTTADRSMRSSAALRSGGGPEADTAQLARSDEASLIASFPASPMMGSKADYDASIVTTYKFKLMTNSVNSSDIAKAAGYWGFPTPIPTIDSPSSADLSFLGAPDISGDPGSDSAGNVLASYYMPNLNPPPIGAPETNVKDVVVGTPSLTPGVGNNLANPLAGQAAIYNNIVESQLDANVPTVTGGAPEVIAGGEAVQLPKP